MKLFLLPSLLLALAAGLGLTGCSESQAEAVAPLEPAVPAASFRAGYGVQLTDAGRRFVELETAEITAPAAGDGDRTRVPADALLRTARGDFVYVANGAWFIRTPVEVGATADGRIEIIDGLYEGDTIVTRGVRALSLTEIQALNGGVGCADGH